MRATLGCLGLLIGLQLTVLCAGQQISISRSSGLSNQGPLRTVTGTVINAVSGVPIRHALVQLPGASPASILTGPDGRFQIDNVPEGQVLLVATKPGFFGQPDPSVTVGAGKNEFRVKLFPTAAIVGRITDPDGEPVENISVQVLTEQILLGHKQLLPQNGANTDDDGVYRIDGLMPGRYVIFANGHVLPPPSWNAPPEISVPTYYPDGRELASAQQLELRAGQELRADFQLHAERGYRIAGTIGGVPAKAGVGVSIENASGQNVLVAGVNFDPGKGQFTVQAVPSGTWTLVLSAWDEGHAFEGRQEVVVHDADITDLQVILHPLTSIPVKINHPATAAAQSSGDPQAFVDSAINAALISVAPFRYNRYFKQAQGSPPVVSFSDVSAGKYKLDVPPWGSECLESAWYGSIDLTRDYLVVGSGEETQPLTINLRSDCSTLGVKLPAGEQPRTGFLLLVPGSPMAEPTIQQISSGSSVSLTLSPGSYQVFAFSTLDGLEYANPEALREYPSQTVNLDPGQKAEVSVDLSERKGN